jgi:hypothetical protein
MATAQEIITDALIEITVLAVGQPLPGVNAAYCLRKLNDLLDSLSNDQDFIYTTSENVLTWVPGQFKYLVGNPIGGTFSGTLVSGSPTISGVTLPSNLVANGDLSDVQAAVPAGTTIVSFGSGTVTMSQNAKQTVSSPEVFTYTTPGDFKIPRPLRLQRSYTRVFANGTLGLDYWFDIVSMERYNEILFKGITGPWPLICAYQPTFPLGTLWVYQAPGIAGELHLFTDLILSQFATLTTNYNLPQGYNLAIKTLLAFALCSPFGKTASRELMANLKNARALIKGLNAEPVVTLRYDTEIVRSQVADASWILDGGFR